jgi:hypothetical protein
LWRRSGSCKDVTKDDSRVFCTDHNTLVAARKSRKTIDDYNADLQTKEGKETRKQADKKDEQAVVFARWLHVTAETVSDLLACVVAFLIEAGSVLLPWFAFSPRNRQEPAVPGVPHAVQSPPALPPAPEVVEEDAVERTAQAWLDANVARRRGSFTLSADIWAHYTANCKALDRTALGSFLRKRGFTAVKKGGTMRYEGIVLLPIGKPPLRLAADNTKARHQMAARNNASAVAAVECRRAQCCPRPRTTWSTVLERFTGGVKMIRGLKPGCSSAAMPSRRITGKRQSAEFAQRVHGVCTAIFH